MVCLDRFSNAVGPARRRLSISISKSWCVNPDGKQVLRMLQELRAMIPHTGDRLPVTCFRDILTRKGCDYISLRQFLRRTQSKSLTRRGGSTTSGIGIVVFSGQHAKRSR